MSYEFRNISVLVVESTRAMFDLTRSVLNTFGIEKIHSAYDSKTSFEKYCAYRPDLVIIDWLSPPDNSLELIKRIRTDDASPNPFVPIIMMTGFSQKRRVTDARDSGITEFLIKPFTAQTLYKRIERIIETPRQFVRAPGFVGPDRRRHRADDFEGDEQRQERLKEERKASDVARDIRNRGTKKD